MNVEQFPTLTVTKHVMFNVAPHKAVKPPHITLFSEKSCKVIKDLAKVIGGT